MYAFIAHKQALNSQFSEKTQKTHVIHKTNRTKQNIQQLKYYDFFKHRNQMFACYYVFFWLNVNPWWFLPKLTSWTNSDVHQRNLSSICTKLTRCFTEQNWIHLFWFQPLRNTVLQKVGLKTKQNKRHSFKKRKKTKEKCLSFMILATLLEHISRSSCIRNFLMS